VKGLVEGRGGGMASASPEAGGERVGRGEGRGLLEGRWRAWWCGGEGASRRLLHPGVREGSAAA
jgi:hypothetical protein